MIQKNLDKKISVEDLAKEACLCKGYFTRLFKEKMKTLPTHYIIQRKIERAQQMLTIKDISIRDVAAELGYDDCSHFISIFKGRPVSLRKTSRCIPPTCTDTKVNETVSKTKCLLL